MRDFTHPGGELVYPRRMHSEKWAEELFREDLGRFTHSVTLLALVDYVERATHFSMNNKHGADIIDAVMEAEDELDFRLKDEKVRFIDVLAEVRYWWEDQGDWESLRAMPVKGSYVSDFNSMLEDKESIVREIIDRLRDVCHYPNLHDYFAVGIWDIAEAKKYAESGIDPEMAARL